MEANNFRYRAVQTMATARLKRYLTEAVACFTLDSSTSAPKTKLNIDKSLSQDRNRVADLFNTVKHSNLASGGFLSRVNKRKTCGLVLQNSHADLIAAFLDVVASIFGNRHNNNDSNNPDWHSLSIAYPKVEKLCACFLKHHSSLMDIPFSRALVSTFRLYWKCASAVEKCNKASTMVNSQLVNNKRDSSLVIGETAKKAYIMNLQKIVGLSLNSRGDPLCNKRRSLLPLTSLLLRMYLRDGQYFLCDKLLRELGPAIDIQQELKNYPASEATEFAYYIGRVAVIRERYKDARTHLSFAFRRCVSFANKQNQNQTKQKGVKQKETKTDLIVNRNLRCILRLLVPINMVLGHVPSDDFLAKYNLQEYRQIRAAVKAGNIGTLRKVLERNQTRFARWGVFFTLEKLEAVTLRNLFRLVYLAEGSTRVPLTAMECALRLAGCDEQECMPGQAAYIIANLTEQGLVRCYISYDHQKVVLSIKEPFPPLRSILAKTK